MIGMIFVYCSCTQARNIKNGNPSGGVQPGTFTSWPGEILFAQRQIPEGNCLPLSKIPCAKIVPEKFPLRLYDTGYIIFCQGYLFPVKEMPPKRGHSKFGVEFDANRKNQKDKDSPIGRICAFPPALFTALTNSDGSTSITSKVL